MPICVIRSLATRQMGNSTMAKEAIFPRTLTEFGYGFDRGGKLRKIDPGTGLTSDEGFEFKVSDDPQYNQKRYEALGEVINEYIYELLEKEGLRRIPVPKASSNVKSELRSFAFASNDAMENDKLMIIIHGSGVVRAGQWARRLIINDNLDSGTQIPYIRRAKDLGYAILVLNTNDNEREIDGETEVIPGSEDPYTHMRTVWSDYVKASKAEKIAIVAHSYGGVCTVKFAIENQEEFVKKVFAVAFTDSVHSHVLPVGGINHVTRVARNWVSSKEPLDMPEDTTSGDVECVSAGTSVHEMTSWSSIDSVFKFFEDRYKTSKTADEL